MSNKVLIEIDASDQGYVKGVAKALRNGIVPSHAKVTADKGCIYVEGIPAGEVEDAMKEYCRTSEHHSGVKFKYSIKDLDMSKMEEAIEQKVRQEYGSKIAILKQKQEEQEKRLYEQKVQINRDKATISELRSSFESEKLALAKKGEEHKITVSEVVELTGKLNSTKFEIHSLEGLIDYLENKPLFELIKERAIRFVRK